MQWSCCLCQGCGEEGSAQLHVVLLDELHEVYGVGELQADGAAVKGGGSRLQHLLVVELTGLGHQLQRETSGLEAR